MQKKNGATAAVSSGSRGKKCQSMDGGGGRRNERKQTLGVGDRVGEKRERDENYTSPHVVSDVWDGR